MDAVEEIEAAINRLGPDEYRRLAQWFREHDQDVWDAKLETDSESGRLDVLFREAELDVERGEAKTWPPAV